MDEEKLREFVKQRAREVWKDEIKPYHLARVSPDLFNAKKVTVKSILGEEVKLADFARKIEGLIFFQDENNRANVSVRPEGTEVERGDFSEPNRVKARKRVSGTSRLSAGELATVKFLRQLGALKDEDVREIQIPIHVLVKLASQK